MAYGLHRSHRAARVQGETRVARTDRNGHTHQVSTGDWKRCFSPIPRFVPVSLEGQSPAPELKRSCLPRAYQLRRDEILSPNCPDSRMNHRLSCSPRISHSEAAYPSSGSAAEYAGCDDGENPSYTLSWQRRGKDAMCRCDLEFLSE
jgi:hypothetical protein